VGGQGGVGTSTSAGLGEGMDPPIGPGKAGGGDTRGGPAIILMERAWQVIPRLRQGLREGGVPGWRQVSARGLSRARSAWPERCGAVMPYLLFVSSCRRERENELDVTSRRDGETTGAPYPCLVAVALKARPCAFVGLAGDRRERGKCGPGGTACMLGLAGRVVCVDAMVIGL
jgi:hypothetical protein